MIAVAVLLMVQASVPAVGEAVLPSYAPATAEQVLSQFAKLCLNGPDNKAAFVEAVKASEWGFTRRQVDGPHPNRMAVDGHWLSRQGTVSAYHGEPNLSVSLPYRCGMHVSPDAGSDVEKLEQASERIFGSRPTSRFVTPDRTNLQWYDATFSERFSRQISLAHLLKGAPQQTLQMFVIYTPRKTQ